MGVMKEAIVAKKVTENRRDRKEDRRDDEERRGKESPGVAYLQR